MNITILSNRDIASAYALSHLVTGLTGHKLQVFLSARVGKHHSHTPKALQKLSAFDAALVEGRQGQGQRFQASGAFATLEAELHQPITLLSSVKTKTGLSALRRSQADLIISIRFGLILHQEAIDLAKLGVINLHSGILPSYKGVMATFWAMKNRETNIGTTLHYIQNKQIDSGDVIAISKQAVDYRRSYLWNVLRLYPQGCRDIISAVKQLSSNQALNAKAQKSSGHYYSFPDDNDIKAFADQGNCLFEKNEILALL
ncbi:MAG: formyl transferase [Cellvibrionaceae bacterium]|nr:formyl transferase [Cellvibrionaceae bacterium]